MYLFYKHFNLEVSIAFHRRRKMKTVFWMLILGMLQNVDYTYGSGTPSRIVLFPDDNDEEASQNFEFSKQKQPQQTTNLHDKSDEKMEFRIDSDDIPCVKTSLLFCEELTNRVYPTKYIEKILATADVQAYENYFNKTVPSDDSLDVRISDDVPIELCRSFKRLIYPQVAMNVQNDWRFVIQSNQSRQPIRVEICQKKNSKCIFSETFPNGYVSACVQKNTKVPLLSLGENGELVSYDYEFPSFCQCELYYHRRF